MRLSSCLIRLMTGCLLVATAVTCQSYAYFDLDHTGTHALSAGDAPDVTPLEGLAALNLGAHPSMVSQGLGPEDVTYVTLARAALRVETPPTGQDLSFIDTVELHIAALGLEDRVIARAEAPEAALNLVPLTIETGVLTAYFDKKTPTFTLHTTYRAPAPSNVTLSAQVSLQVRVGEPHGTCQR